MSISWTTVWSVIVALLILALIGTFLSGARRTA